MKASPVEAELEKPEGTPKVEPYVCPDYDDSWVNGGWCQLGWGGDAVRLHLAVYRPGSSSLFWTRVPFPLA